MPQKITNIKAAHVAADGQVAAAPGDNRRIAVLGWFPYEDTAASTPELRSDDGSGTIIAKTALNAEDAFAMQAGGHPVAFCVENEALWAVGPCTVVWGVEHLYPTA